MSTNEIEYDVIVIGSGPSGRTVSLRSAKIGLSVVLIEDELVGGDCHYWACVPSKALLRPPEALSEAKEVEGSKQAVTNGVNVRSVLERRDEFVDHWKDDKLQGMLEKSGVKVLHGRGRLTGPRRVVVDSSNGIQSTLTARYAVVLSTGSRSSIPAIPGLAESRPWTNREATGATKAPSRLAILGGGPVAVEMATAWSSLGSKEITLIERGERLLGKYEPFVGERLGQAFKKKGITVLTGTNIKQVRRISSQQPGEEAPVEITLDNGSKIISDELLVATGRKPNSEDLGLDKIGLESGAWLDVDDTCLVKGVEGGWLYAVGDINRRALLTHEGKYQARACAAAIAGRMDRRIKDGTNEPWSRWIASTDRGMIPQVIFTDPQIASVGLTEQDARSKGINVRSVDCELGSVDGARLHSEDYGGQARIVVDEERHVLVGVTLIGPQVGS